MICIDTATKINPKLKGTEAIARYCACMTDSIRKNKGNSPLNPKKHAPTWKQIERCAQHANNPKRLDGRTPYNGSKYDNSEFLTKLVKACSNKIGAEGKSVDYQIIYCGCYVDAARINMKRPTISEKQKAKCDQAAKYWIKYRTHLSVK